MQLLPFALQGFSFCRLPWSRLSSAIIPKESLVLKKRDAIAID
jgi:hypothetical protein